ncbi:hypothetical protein DPMN_129437 [Dreissena polymorpha]|uniref:Cytochrome P450 n=1 Tax=Dreissena polymorpha TaxID=45954 RepID=A0A9D4H363_DREPO|nr:hypothetical protein DPMN_129437 [Dreissena polymorpha]
MSCVSCKNFELKWQEPYAVAKAKFPWSSSRFRRYFCLWMGLARVTLVVNHPTTVKAIMKTSEPKLTGLSGKYRFGLPWLGPGLLIAEGARWSRSRRLLTPAFHFDILKPYVQVYNEAVQKLVVSGSGGGCFIGDDGVRGGREDAHCDGHEGEFRGVLTRIPPHPGHHCALCLFLRDRLPGAGVCYTQL